MTAYLLRALVAFFILLAPAAALADDISATARSVVRVVTVAMEGDDLTGLRREHLPDTRRADGRLRGDSGGGCDGCRRRRVRGEGGVVFAAHAEASPLR